MAKDPQARAMSRRVLFLDTRNLEVEVGAEEIQILIDSTVTLPFKALDVIEAWVKEEGGFSPHEAMSFRDEMADFIARKLDEKFLLSRLR